jgi:tetratricopeptide (TPR) repeat protein
MKARLLGLLAIFVVSACSFDPAVQKQKFLDSGDRYLAAKQYDSAIIEYSKALQKDEKFGDAYERLGRVYLEKGDKVNAWRSYQRAANLKPNDIPLQITAGGMLLIGQRYDDARRLAEAVLEKHPDNVEALVLKANSLVGLENLDTAITQLEQAIRMSPNESELYANLGSMHASSGQVAEAEAMFRKAVETSPKNAQVYLPLGNFYWATGRPAQAEATFLKAIEIDPKNVLAHRALATFYLGAGYPLKAEEPLKFVADASDDVDHRIALGDYYLVTGRPQQGVPILQEIANHKDGEAKARTRLAAYTYAQGHRLEARQEVDGILARYPKHAPALLLKARFMLDMGRHEDGLRLATQASEAQDGYIEALSLVGQLHAENGDLFQATEAYQRVLEINPMSAEAQIQLSRLFYADGTPDKSQELMNRVLKRVPENRNTRLSLVRALMERGNLDLANTYLKQLLDADPDSPVVHSLMGALLALKKDYVGSRRWYERALRGNPAMVDALSGLVGLDLQQSRPADALARARAASAQSPRNVDLLLLLAKTYGATHDLKSAEATLRQAIDTDQDRFEAYGMLGQLLYQQNRLEDGRREFEAVLKLRPRSVPALTMIAIILRREGQTDDAMEYYRKILAIDPQAAVAANNLAWIYAEQGRNFDEAILLARVAKKKLPEVPEVSDTIGWVYYRAGQATTTSLAIPYLQDCVAKDPRNPLYRYHLGAAYARNGKTVEARQELQEALRLDADFQGAAEVRRILISIGG